MRDNLSPEEWLIEESSLDPAQLNVFETLFTIGNGYLGTRGTLEEGHKAELSGTYLNGVFDAHDSPVIDLVNAPDWLSLVVHVDGVRLDIQSCTVVEHVRRLDMRQGLLSRSTVFEDAAGHRTRIATLRFASFSDQHLCVLRVEITPLNHSAPITVESAIDGRRFNLDRMPLYLGKPDFHPEVKWRKWAHSKHLDEVARAVGDEASYLEMRTIDSGITVGYAASVQSTPIPARRVGEQGYERISERLEFAPEAGQTITLDKFVTIYTSRDVDTDLVWHSCLNSLVEHDQAGFDAALDAHRASWLAKWHDCDCRIVGDAEANKAARFNIYHLLIAANENDPAANIGAKTLSGEGYRGHVFWDTEIFMLPFFIYTQPATARALMLYRYNTLPGARENARAGGFRGAQFAWESADSGRETTPKWTPDGAHRIWTGEEEIHVSADVAYGVLTYVAATGDIDFMLDYGAEILFETSRFWTDRLEYSAETDQYELKRVIGPDEFHEHIDNNTFTNRMVQWHLVQSVRVFDDLLARYPQQLHALTSRLQLDAAEVGAWKEVSDKILIPHTPDDQPIEQFEGYFGLSEVPIVEWDENDMPCYPQGYDHFNLGETKLLKQPDIVMLNYILPDEFTAENKRVNYEYYEGRTMHKSSLSPAIHSIMGIEVGHPVRALQYYRRSAFVDLANNQGNTQDGIHAASAGGTWQSLVFGFGGFRAVGGRMTFKPWLPADWHELSFRLKWHHHTVDVRIDHERATFTLEAPSGATEDIEVCGQPISLRAGEQVAVPLSSMAGAGA